jgi:hypothetical protein
MRRTPLPKVLVYRAEPTSNRPPLRQVWAVVTEARLDIDAPHFRPDDVEAGS